MPENFHIDMPEAVRNIIHTIEEHGFKAYAVGGCIRDSILGRNPDDWDITTSAVPSQIKTFFKRTVDTGIAHGTVTIMIDKTGYEITTYRIDGEYEDGRHPKSVEFSDRLVDDLCRRDFTINAMAYNDTDGFVDEFKGLDDLDAKIIRCVGEPELRFTEDALRMMRAIRFSAQLGFTIDEATCNQKAFPFNQQNKHGACSCRAWQNAYVCTSRLCCAIFRSRTFCPNTPSN